MNLAGTPQGHAGTRYALVGGARSAGISGVSICNLSAHGEEILRVTNLDHLWPVCPSRAEALGAVRCKERWPAEAARP